MNNGPVVHMRARPCEDPEEKRRTAQPSIARTLMDGQPQEIRTRPRRFCPKRNTGTHPTKRAVRRVRPEDDTVPVMNGR
jgi:hypothetical protein